MSNFELIDDYLANRLNGADRKAFEQQLEGDPSLKRDVEFQRQVVEGVRNARAAELKSMLNNVPIGGSAWTGTKMAAAVVSAGIVATLLYFYLQDNSEKTAPLTPLTKEITELKDATKEVEPAKSIEAENSSETTVIDSALNNESLQEKELQKSRTTKKNKTTTPVRKPDLQVTDPSDELSEEATADAKGSSTMGRGEISPSKMEVVTGVTDKKHNFHYQFSQGRLMLFGPFDKSLYEILEIHGDGHAVFLFYKENYYLLDEAQTTITALQPIRDGQLLKRLREYRGK